MRKNILLIDDDHDVRRLVSVILEQSGFGVRSVADGSSAIAELQMNSYDLMVLDISMPNLNGFQVLKAIRSMARFIGLPVIMLTGSRDRDEISKVQEYNVSDYVLKPPQIDDLISRVEKALDGSPAHEEVHLKPIDAGAAGSFEIPLRLISISANGMVLFSQIGVENGFILESLRLRVFQELGVEQTKFRVTECTALKGGGFHYYVSFLGVNHVDQERIRRWISSQPDRN